MNNERNLYYDLNILSPMKMKLILLVMVTGLFLSCNRSPLKHRPIKIALSSASDNYIKWIHRVDSTVNIIDLKSLPIDSAIQKLITCDGIIFTGGEDVVPSYYGKTADSSRCETNPARDSLEFALITKAFKVKMPVLGICRGQQIINVSLGGTLIVDIPTDHPSEVVHRCDDYTRCYHHVIIEPGTLLKEVCKADTGWVTSNHHQAVENPGRTSGFRPWQMTGFLKASNGPIQRIRVILWQCSGIPNACPKVIPFQIRLRQPSCRHVSYMAS